jgi:hypothetical protein
LPPSLAFGGKGRLPPVYAWWKSRRVVGGLAAKFRIFSPAYCQSIFRRGNVPMKFVAVHGEALPELWEEAL